MDGAYGLAIADIPRAFADVDTTPSLARESPLATHEIRCIQAYGEFEYPSRASRIGPRSPAVAPRTTGRRPRSLAARHFPSGAPVKLALVISSLAGGGAERVTSLLANAWTRTGTDVSLLTLGPTGNDAYYLNSDVRRIGLDLLRPAGNPAAAAFANVRRIRRLREAFRELNPDVIVSFMTSTNVLSVLAAKPLKLPVIVSERISPEAHLIPRSWQQLRKHAYRRAALVVAQTERTAAWLRKEIRGATVEVVANPVQVEPGQSADAAAQTALAACGGHNIVLAAGRLDRQKGFDLLLHAFAALVPQQPAWRLVILGEGPEGNSLRELSQQLRISDRVVFPGFSRTLHFLMRKSQLFVLPSRYEGMPNALAEAMACAVPCVSFDCPAGPAELISHEHNGLLVPAEDVAKLTLAMDRLMKDQELRQRLGSAAQRSVLPYSMDIIMSRWNTLLVRIHSSIPR